MSTPELIAAVGVPLLTLMVALIGIIYRNDQKAYETYRSDSQARIGALEKQNLEQETRIATLTAQLSFAREGNDRLVATLDKLDDRLESMTRGFSELRSEVQNLARRLPTGYTPGTMPAVRK